MKLRITFALFVIILNVVPCSLHAQTVFPGKQTIDKKEYLGLILSNAISEKYLSDYWESYISKFGKVKGKRGIYTIEKASIPPVSPNPIQLTSEVSSLKKQAQVFMALYVDGNYVANSSDQTYKAAESVLKDFSDYASKHEDVRVADEAFTTAEKSHQKLQSKMEDNTKEIERTEKKLNELRLEMEKGKVDSQNSILDLQNKQKALEAVKSKL
ncbi:hypothetical protein [Dyadobacter sp. NIV53]|uniref:hypothetical protein n=1 Tax=Dyadobacter sp. NIV53 TaxID=2861765 RepID=UPI001C876B92|nr:hypothetical protein [Dyadobacter sp. NIV53]